MKAYKRNSTLIVLDNVRKIMGDTNNPRYGYFTLYVHYNDGTIDKFTFEGNEIMMQSTLTTIQKIMLDK